MMKKKQNKTSTFEVQEQSLPKTEAGPGQKRSSLLQPCNKEECRTAGRGQECRERPQWRHKHARMGWKLRGDREHRTGLWHPSSGSGLKVTAACQRLCAPGVTKHPGAGQLPRALTQLPHLHSCANSFSEEACPFPDTNYFSLYCSSVYNVWHSIKNYYTHTHSK